jgi:hypothetical protein
MGGRGKDTASLQESTYAREAALPTRRWRDFFFISLQLQCWNEKYCEALTFPMIFSSDSSNIFCSTMASASRCNVLSLPRFLGAHADGPMTFAEASIFKQKNSTRSFAATIGLQQAARGIKDKRSPAESAQPRKRKLKFAAEIPLSCSKQVNCQNLRALLALCLRDEFLVPFHLQNLLLHSLLH